MRKMMMSAALLFMATAANAQDMGVDEMRAALSGLETTAANVLRSNGFEADVMSLTLSQLAQIAQAMSIESNAEMRALIVSALKG
ncbi:hypothetical protein [uncultured Marivita sp.]|uniref:hypothetical protein n=1 Tax=uncultured Marivita sp. TaxID=888080 RepID=UPI00260D8EF7|nr:hypothetical protein [uncultured Marivita sp.]